jgi:hypothetical protein
MRPVGHGVAYSSWNPKTLRWDYWAVGDTPPLRAGVIAPAPSLPQRPLGVSPERASRRLPAGARRVGEGPLPRGLVASRQGMGSLDLLGSSTFKAVLLLAAGYVLCRWLEKRR